MDRKFAKAIELPIDLIFDIDSKISVYYIKYERESFLYFISIVERKASENPEKDKRYEWARLKGTKIKYYLGNDYKNIIKIMIDAKIVNRDAFYIVGQKSYNYSINYIHDERKELSKIELSEQLQRRIIKSKEFARPTKAHLRNQFDLLKSKSFDFDAFKADIWLNSQQLNNRKFRSYQSSITHLFERNIFVIEDEKTGRIFTNFNLVKREFRQLCTIDNEKLTGIDLKSSQPYILASMMLNSDPCNPDYLLFYEIVTNHDIYDWMLKEFHKTNPSKSIINFKGFDENHYAINEIKQILTRNDIKPEFLKVLFKDNRGSTPFQVILKNSFPEVYKFICNAKKDKKNELALSLQKAESKIFISAYKEMIKQNLKVLTVHDSIYCKISDINLVEGILKNSFDKLGYKNYILKSMQN